MRAGDLPSDAPGHYRESHPRPYYIPEKLPVSAPIDIDAGLASTISDATFQLGRIDGIS